MSSPQIEDIYPLSPVQAGMLFHSLYHPESAVYQIVIGYRIEGPLDEDVFEKSWNRTVARHAILRTSFATEGVEEPLQIVWRDVRVPLARDDLTRLSDTERRDRSEERLRQARVGFALDEPPLMRLALLRESGTSRLLLWSMHHALLDGWSKSLVLADVFTAYEAAVRGELDERGPAPPYRDYIAWLQERQPNAVAAESFWRKHLSGFSAPTPIAADAVPAPASRNGDGGSLCALRLSRALTARVSEFARRNRVTVNLVLQAAWASLLSRYTGEEDIVFGNTVSTRPPGRASSESMVGLLINTLPMRACIRSGDSARTLLEQLRQQSVATSPYELTPLTAVQGWSEIPRGTPLFDSVFIYENFPEDSFRSRDGSLSVRRTLSVQRTNYPLEFSVIPGPELSLELGFDKDRFEPFAIEQMLEHARRILEGFVENPETPIAILPLLTPAEERKILFEWNDTRKEYPDARLVPELFEEQARQNPHALALVHQSEQWTYQRLNEHSNRLARFLISRGVGREVLVALCADRSPQMVIGLLAILKAGGAYLPLDPAYPRERQSFMVEDSGAELVLTTGAAETTLPTAPGRILSLDGWRDTIGRESASDVASGPGPRDLAYVLYTSGSTGRPKGVEIEHDGLANYVRFAAERFGVRRDERLLQFASLSFDTAAEEIFSTLSAGGTLVLRTDEMVDTVATFLAKCEEWRVTVVNLPTSYWHELVAVAVAERLKIPESVRLVVIGGERALPDRLAQWRELTGNRVQLLNGYGPTETTVAATFWDAGTRSQQAQARTVPIGRPIPNVRTYVLDKRLRPVPVGVAGELHIGGAGVARGYRNRPDLTAEKFIPDPFQVGNGRLYRTGDRARFRCDGELEYLGRVDGQIKLRGFRIELGEIEAALRGVVGVREALVRPGHDARGETRLVAYVVPDDSNALSSNELPRVLKENLPAHMVPSRFVLLDKLPRTPSGKLDLGALPPADFDQGEFAIPSLGPRTPIEESLVEIWKSVLRLERVGVRDNFFHLGGHSLLAMQVLSRAREAFDVELSLKELFVHPTVEEFGLIVAQARAEGVASEEIERLLSELEMSAGEKASQGADGVRDRS